MSHGTVVGTDTGMAAELEDFIRQQKTKLAHDRAVSRPRMSPRGRVESPPAESSSHHQGMPHMQAEEEGGFMAKMGTYEDRRKKLQDERKREYNAMLQAKNQGMRKTAGGSGDAPSSLAPRDSRPVRGPAARNPVGDAPSVLTPRNGRPLRGQHDMEYENMLSGQSKRHERAYTPIDHTDYPRHRQTPPPDTARPYNGSSGLSNMPRHKSRNEEPEFYASLPLRNHPSAQQRKEQERNREYNEFLKGSHGYGGHTQIGSLRPRRDSMSDGDDEYQQFLQQRAPRRGWATPTYEETLEEKRQQERRYRRHDDPELYQPFELRNSVSDGHLDRNYDEDDRRLRLDNDRRPRGPYRNQEAKKVRFHAEKPVSRQNGQTQREPEFTEWLSSVKHRTPQAADDEDDEFGHVIATPAFRYYDVICSITRRVPAQGS
ncbi:hypothetical protein LSAT2_019074 [Lamellibrachia satsuma]|nr:hypothetical protein LSAT2_019074 [Lamellibrachia satsuma]